MNESHNLLNIDPPLSHTLNSKSNDIVKELYVPCLSNSKRITGELAISVLVFLTSLMIL